MIPSDFEPEPWFSNKGRVRPNYTHAAKWFFENYELADEGRLTWLADVRRHYEQTMGKKFKMADFAIALREAGVTVERRHHRVYVPFHRACVAEEHRATASELVMRHFDEHPNVPMTTQDIIANVPCLRDVHWALETLIRRGRVIRVGDGTYMASGDAHNSHTQPTKENNR